MTRLGSRPAQATNPEDTMSAQPSRPRRERGQVIVIAALAMVGMIAFAALILEGGNAYAQQRVVQNGADASANAGAVVLAQRLAGTSKTDTDVFTAVSAAATNNRIDAFVAYYTNVSGQYLDNAGAVTTNKANAAVVGSGDAVDAIPSNAQGVALDSDRTFPTFLGKAIGFNSFKASANATAVTGKLIGGRFLPVVFPISIVDCDTNGSLGSVPADNWQLAQPDDNDADLQPEGIEYIVPLCKTGGGSFQILDLDPTQRCDDEVANPPSIQWDVLPVDVDSDNGNNCAKPIADYVNANLVGETVLIPICDNTVGTDPCGTTGGSHATYRITRITAFYIDYMDDSNNRNNSNCQSHTSPSGQQLVTIAGNGSSELPRRLVRPVHRLGPRRIGHGHLDRLDRDPAHPLIRKRFGLRARNRSSSGRRGDPTAGGVWTGGTDRLRRGAPAARERCTSADRSPA